MGARAIEFLLLCIHNKLGIGISPIPSGADDDRRSVSHAATTYFQ